MFELLKEHNKKVIAAVGMGILAYCLSNSKKQKKTINKDELSPETVISEGKKVSIQIL